MAQLKDTVISGSLRVTDTTYTTTADVSFIKASTAAGAAAHGTGTAGQALISNGTSAAYWGNPGNATNASQLGGSAASTYLQGDDIKAGSGITVSTAAGVATVSADLRTTTKLGAAGATAAATETTKIYAVQMDSNGDLAVKVPWTDVDEKLKMTPASATKFYPAGGTSQTSAVSTAYFSSAVYIQGTSVVAANFVGTATTASYAANAAKVNNLTVQTAVPSGAVFTDTKNTAGSTNSDSKLFLIGATSQAANPQTYSDSEVYTTNGTLTTNKVQVGGTAVTLQFNSTTKSLDFVFA